MKQIKCTKCDHQLIIPDLAPGDIIDGFVQGIGMRVESMRVDSVSEANDSVVLSGGLIRGIQFDLHRLLVTKRNGESTMPPAPPIPEPSKAEQKQPAAPEPQADTAQEEQKPPSPKPEHAVKDLPEARLKRKARLKAVKVAAASENPNSTT